MTAEPVVAALVGVVVALLVAILRLQKPPEHLVRVNVRGLNVPAVLGEGVVAGGVAGAVAAAVAGEGSLRPGVSVILVVFAFYLVGALDDRRGDEPTRGFGGHLKALARGRVTGGAVKLFAGGVAAWIAGVVATGEIWAGLVAGAIAALAANLLNLLDRAPGRAGKVALLAGALLIAVAPAGPRAALIAIVAAVAAVAPFDLRERGMLGDAGANPIGAALGLVLAVALPAGGDAAALVILLTLNILSEKVSFSGVINSNRVLATVDRWGRPR